MGRNALATPLGIKRRNIYIALEELDFIWCESEIPDIERLWNEGFSIWEIGQACDRDPDEVLILIMDRVRKGAIGNRPGGVMGRRKRH